ncbi:Bacteriophage terminase large (ATPase) subunit and inactivated derivatives [Serratia quinivorans]|uniref:terminase large subunit domain-containing protein n=1 Tax=Serratia quinivorans TaxID=137545 RepID=UPI00217845F9|nr:terminase family protein [Serratia quinivorans]CAI1768586.1 Bacteriophage terminase large (ATPase) subunit and inactivated derivatives [Serratia quinivorans]
MTDFAQFSTLTYRNKVRAVAVAICRAGHDAMRKHMHILKHGQYLNKYFKVDTFAPYKFQLQWYQSGADFHLRYLSAANRIGKTYAGAVEFAFHATGDYPGWWNGYRCPVGTLWAIGVDIDATRKVLQKELLGTDDYRRKEEIGTGSIPRDLIDFDSFVARGEAVKSFRVWNKQGGQSAVHFYASTQDKKSFMGQAIVYAWVDEQSENEDELIAQCTTRTATTGGVVVCTATPEIGATDFYNRCRQEDAIYFQNARWEDAPHITPAARERLLAETPYYQRKMRSQGIPILGDGAIYPYELDHITCAPFAIPDHWLVLASTDFGYSGISDPSVITFIAYDQESGKRYLFQEWGSKEDREAYGNSHLPDYMARKLIGVAPPDWSASSEHHDAVFEGLGLPSIAVKLPHDGDGIQPGTQTTRAELMRITGANVCMDTFEIPPDMAPLENNRKSLIGSISIIGQWFQDGNFKIFNTCTETLREFHLYQWKRKGVRTVPSDKDNHFMDAMRYGAIRVRDDGVPMYEARKDPDSGVWEVSNPYNNDMKAFEL